jgi:hypothetical protein
MFKAEGRTLKVELSEKKEEGRRSQEVLQSFTSFTPSG